MKNISIIVPKGNFILSSVIGTYKVFNSVNQYLCATGAEPAFHIDLVGLDGESAVYDGIFAIRPTRQLTDDITTSLVVIPAIMPPSVAVNMSFIPWILAQHSMGAEVASLCTGAFLLAETGLLKGRQCTTHWIAADAFRQKYPDIDLQTEKIIIDDAGIYCSGGAYSFLNLLLHIVEKYCGREVAIYLAKLLEVDIQRDAQSQFIIFEGQKAHEDVPIKKAQQYIEHNIGEKISVSQLAGLFAISPRNFERRFKKATSNTPVEYLQRVKVEAAKKKLEAGQNNINEVMYSVGYADNKAFRTLFRKVTGLSPQEYRKKYGRNAGNTPQVSVQ